MYHIAHLALMGKQVAREPQTFKNGQNREILAVLRYAGATLLYTDQDKV